MTETDLELLPILLSLVILKTVDCDPSSIKTHSMEFASGCEVIIKTWKFTNLVLHVLICTFCIKICQLPISLLLFIMR
jgi:hypothetical protein